MSGDDLFSHSEVVPAISNTAPPSIPWVHPIPLPKSDSNISASSTPSVQLLPPHFWNALGSGAVPTTLGIRPILIPIITSNASKLLVLVNISAQNTNLTHR